MMRPPHALTAILPCRNLDASEAFYGRLGFSRPAVENADDYRILADNRGGHLHLTKAIEGWLTPGRNPFGLYLYTEEVDALALQFTGLTIEKAGPKTSPGACTNFLCLTPTTRWCGSGG
jgi:hypothetical protein